VDEIPPVYRDWRYASPYPEVAVWPYFHDPNRDSLTFTATADDHPGLHVGVADGFVTVAAWSRSGIVTVTATDPGGLKAQQTFEYAETSPTPPLRPPGSIPSAPRVSRPIPSLQIFHGQSAIVNLRRHFTDEPGRSFAATSSAPDTAAVSVSGHLLTIDGLNLGWSLVSATASTRGGSTKQDFKVLVDPPTALPNSAPVFRGGSYRKVVPSGVSFVLDVSRYFIDPEEDALTYEAAPLGPVATFYNISVPTGRVALSDLSRTSIKVRGTKTGFLRIGLTATDPGGLPAGGELMVEITPPVGR
jgi:hypothetical protein